MTTSRLTTGIAAVLAVLGTSAEAFAQCYVDSVAGNDSASGSSEADPVKSQAAIPSGCTEVRYKRGSIFNEPVATGGVGGGMGGGVSRTVFTNYGDASAPLPAFVTTQTVVSAFGGGITISGLHLEGSEASEDAASGGGMGVCVMIGGNSQLINNEITDCGIGIMLNGENTVVQGNVVYDLFKMVADSSDPDVYVNSVGGAEGIFINGSNNEVAYNSFINCKAPAEWTDYDGGATEVAVSNGGSVSGLRVHHNYSFNNCGFFEVSGTGTFSDSEFYYNVSIDSAWMFLLQVNETTLSNIRWENNTIVHHADAYSPSISMVFEAELTPETVFFNNNLVILDGASAMMGLDAAISQSNNLFLTTGASSGFGGGSDLFVQGDPGVVNLAGTAAADFDLMAGSPAIDVGMAIAGHPLDFLNRTAPDSSGLIDIGAFEYNSSVGAALPETAAVPDDVSDGVPEAPASAGSDSGSGAPGSGAPGSDAPGSDTSGGETGDDEGCSCTAAGSRTGGASLGLVLLGGALGLARGASRRRYRARGKCHWGRP